MTELQWGVRVQQALMAAVPIGPTTKTTTKTVESTACRYTSGFLL
jgi:hypothetical protein